MAESTMAPEDFIARARAIEQEVGNVIVGQAEVVRGILTGILAGGHILLEGVPGLGKTMLIRTLGEVLDLQFSRIQFTPDLMPADITGTTVIGDDEHGNKVFRFQPGPVFANLVLADEINRATPKTQSALLEAMQERRVTVAKATHPLPEPFFVMATQNPIEMEGTYPLPEAQLDRFLYKLNVRFPSGTELVEIANRTTGARPPAVKQVADGPTIAAMIALARELPVARPVLEYAARLVLNTHPERAESLDISKRFARFGASPRGMQALVNGARIRALLDGRYNVAYEDIAAVAHPALRHRLAVNFEGEAEGITTDQIIDEIVKATPEN
jgi:MoxR-like ATPase